MWRSPNHQNPWEGIHTRDSEYQAYEDGFDACLKALKDIVEYRQGPFITRFPEDASIAVIHKERLPELFITKEEGNAK